MDNPVLLFSVIAVVIVAAMLLPRWIRRWSRAAGERSEQRSGASRRTRILADLGTTVVIRASESAAREVVDEVVRRHPRQFTALADGSYGIRFVEADDGVARLVADPGGTRLQAERVREYLGMPKTSDFWNDFRAHVASEAAGRGISVADGPRLLYVRGEPEKDGAATWRAQA
ncbi:hypothetical protein [Microbacterium sp. SD291]|uniref:hypothetical protein n=1 Tax=Microbacterium sp. SD291 TaxID=2782007 RepID=UPI001A966A65|nr:hypothetical protein [Microbacterium sp. SD291]MBO0981452.1 hypothetical protein [Microbacterium sp. SD291]